VIKGSENGPARAPSQTRAGNGIDAAELPPGHPPIETAEDWLGRSFLDDLLGEDEPMRFENMRAKPGAGAPGGKAIITIRITTGVPALADVWQIRMDTFGWVTAAMWTQGAGGPRLDELLATRRVEFRLDPNSENALRAMAMLLFPPGDRPAHVRLPETFPAIPPEVWPYDNPGILEINYRTETLGLADPEDWPGGGVSVPLDVVQLLIATWDDVPPPELRRVVRDLADRRPLILNAALLAEGLVLALEVEGPAEQPIELPLRVAR
jgi:hypothetical protein